MDTKQTFTEEQQRRKVENRKRKQLVPSSKPSGGKFSGPNRDDSARCANPVMETVVHDSFGKQFGNDVLEDIIDVENEMGFGEGEEWEEKYKDSGHHSIHIRAPCKVTADQVQAKSAEKIELENPVDIDLEEDKGMLEGKQNKGNYQNETDRDVKEKKQGNSILGGLDEEVGVDLFVPWDMDQKAQNSEAENDMSDFDQQIKSEESGAGIQLKQQLKKGGKRGTADEMGDQGQRKVRWKTGKVKTHFELLDKASRVRFTDCEKTENQSKSPRIGLDSKVPPRYEHHGKQPSRKDNLESKVRALKNEARKTDGSFQEKQSTQAPEVAKRKKLPSDADTALNMWREEKKAHKQAQERLERLQNLLLQQQEKVVKAQASLGLDGAKDANTILLQLLEDLNKSFKKNFIASKPRNGSDNAELKSEVEQIDRLREKCDLAESERDKVEKKLKFSLQRLKEREKEIEVMCMGREKILEGKVTDLGKWETKCKKMEADISVERELWRQNLTARQMAWKEKKARWVQELKEKEEELASFNMAQTNLIGSLVTTRQRITELKRQFTGRVSSEKATRILEPGATKRECQGILLSRDASPMKGIKRRVGNQVDEQMDAEGLALELESEVKELIQELQLREEILETEKREATNQTDHLRQERKDLEEKISETLSLMEELKEEIDSKESQIENEKIRFEAVIAGKVEQLDALKEQLDAKEQKMETSMQQLKEEVLMMDKEIERERSERKRAMELHADMKQKILKGLRKKEQKWEQEAEALQSKLNGMTAHISLKDERVEILEEELKAKELQIEDEKQKCIAAIKEVKQKAARTILSFAHGKEALLLEHLRERRRAKKAAGDQPNATWKANEGKTDFSRWMGNNQAKDSARTDLRRSLDFNVIQNTGVRKKLDQSFNNVQEEHNDQLLGNDLSFKLLNLHDKRAKQNDDSKGKERAGEQAQEKNNMEKVHLKSMGKHRSFEWPPRKQEFLKLLEERKDETGDAFMILQDTVEDLGWSLQHDKGKENDDMDCHNGGGKTANLTAPKKLRW